MILDNFSQAGAWAKINLHSIISLNCFLYFITVNVMMLTFKYSIITANKDNLQNMF